MTHHPVPSGGGTPSRQVEWLEQAARRLNEAAAAAEPANSQRARTSDWRLFSTWCNQQGMPALPAAPETLAAYLLAHSDPESPVGLRKPSTLRRWVATIGRRHEEAGLERPDADPRIQAVLRRLTATHPEKGRPRRVDPLTTERLTQVLRGIDHDTFPAAVAGCRDAAVLLVAMAGAMRRSELVGLTWADIGTLQSNRIVVRVRQSKTDKLAQGIDKVILTSENPLTCQVCAVYRWADVVYAVDDAVKGTRRVDWLAALSQRVTAKAALHDARERQDKAAAAAARGQHKDALERIASCAAERRDAAWRVVLEQDWHTHRCDTPPQKMPASNTPFLRSVDRHGELGLGHMDGGSIARILKSRVRDAGFDETKFSGHSPRAGHVTSALDRGVTGAALRRQVGWRTEAMVPVYDRHYLPERGNSVDGLGL